MSFDQFELDLKTVHAVQHQLMILGEATKKINEDFRNANIDIPWKKMAGIRDVLIHSYKEADLEIVWDVATIQMLDIIPKIERLLNN